jgi:hypothetical protein
MNIMNPKRTVKEVNFKVICLSEAENDWYYLTDREVKIGKVYTVVRVRGEGKLFESNNPEEWYLLEVRRFVCPDLYVPLAEWREKQIESILND